LVNCIISRRDCSMETYTCDVCGYDYDPKAGDPDNDVAPGTSWDKVPEDWICPVCGAGKDAFEVA
jgi:rubredoxin